MFLRIIILFFWFLDVGLFSVEKLSLCSSGRSISSRYSLMGYWRLIVHSDTDVLARMDFEEYKLLVSYFNKLPTTHRLKRYLQDSSFDKNFRLYSNLLAGLNNLDPRIRIACSISLLERLTVLKRTQKSIYDRMIVLLQPKVHNIFIRETSLNRYYLSRKENSGKIINGSPHQYIKSLDLYITRDLVLAKLADKKLVPSNFKDIDAWYYYSITNVVFGENEEGASIYSLNSKFEILASSLMNPSNNVRKSAANFLAKIYTVNNSLKEDIITLAKEHPILKNKLR